MVTKGGELAEDVEAKVINKGWRVGGGRRGKGDKQHSDPT